MCNGKTLDTAFSQQALFSLSVTNHDIWLGRGKLGNVAKHLGAGLSLFRLGQRLETIPFQDRLDLVMLARLQDNNLPALKAKGLPVPDAVSVLVLGRKEASGWRHLGAASPYSWTRGMCVVR